MKVIFSFSRDALEAFLDACGEAMDSPADLYGARAFCEPADGPGALRWTGWQTCGGATYRVDLEAGTLEFEGSRTSLSRGCVPGSVLYSTWDGSQVALMTLNARQYREWPGGEVLQVESSLPDLPWYGNDWEIPEILAAMDREAEGAAIEDALSGVWRPRCAV